MDGGGLAGVVCTSCVRVFSFDGDVLCVWCVCVVQRGQEKMKRKCSILKKIVV